VLLKVCRSVVSAMLGHVHKRCTAIVLHRESPRPFHFGVEMIEQDTTLACCMHMRKADSTLRSSRAVPHPSTNRALRRLTSEVRRDPVHSTRYGRQRNYLRASKDPTTFPRRADSQEILRLATTSSTPFNLELHDGLSEAEAH
jgi:hypothetical protein